MNDDDITQYLQDHPEFFERNAELLASITVMHPITGRAIPLVERQVLTLRDKHRAIESKLGELIQFGEENDRIGERVHRLAIALSRATTKEAVFNAIRASMQADFSLQVAIRLWSHSGEGAEFAALTEDLHTYAAALTRAYCGPNGQSEPAGWFTATGSEPIGSVALIALRDGGFTLGMMALGSVDETHFYSDMGTLYLDRIGELISATLARVL